MEFQQYTLALLVLRDDAPSLDEQEEDALQDAHMTHLSALHERGEVLAAGPLLGPSDRRFRGLTVYAADLDRARELADDDPAVLAGRYHHEFYPWLVPSGLVTFTPGRLPTSMAEAMQ